MPIRESSLPRNGTEETGKVPLLVAKRIRDAILDKVFKPGDHLGEVELSEKFEVSRSPVREALLALEKEGTVIISPYKGATVKTLSAAELLDIAELRLALISLAVKPAHRHLSPADFDHAYELARQIKRTNNARDYFGLNRDFWDCIFSKAERPILPEMFRQLEDRMTRYEPFFLKVFPTAETRPRHREKLIENYGKGQIAEAFRAYKKIYLEAIDQVIERLIGQEAENFSHPSRQARHA
jgi:DNA-binding GntR family transcriptional regulator